MAATFRSWLQRYLEAHKHAVSGRSIIKRQRELIARQKAAGRNTEASEELLASFERTQDIFEDDLAQIVSAK